MIDPFAAVRTYILSRPAVAAIVGQRVYALELPPGYKPAQGAAIVMNTRGGGVDHTSHILQPAWAFRCYGTDTVAIMQLAQTLFDSIKEVKTSVVSRSEPAVPFPQYTREPGSGWLVGLVFYDIDLKQG